MPKKNTPATATWSKKKIARGVYLRVNSVTGERRFFASLRTRRGTASGTFSTAKKARTFLANSQVDMDNDRFFGNLPGAKLGVGAAVEQFIAGGHATNATLLAHANWWAAQCGDLPLNELTADRVAAELGTLKDSGLSGATVNRYRSALSAMWKHWASARAGEKALVAFEKNPAKGVQKEQEADGRVVTLSKVERAALLKACAPDIELLAAVRLALVSGCRHGELAKLRWKDVDLVHGTAALTKTKNGKSRPIAFDPATTTAFKQLQRGVGNVHVFAERIRNRNRLRTSWKAALASAGLPDMRWHDLRHVSVQVAIESGSTLLEAGLHTGHSSLSALARYTHLESSHQRRIAGRVGEAL